MQVYRLCNKEEIDKLLNEKTLKNIGHEFTVGGLNSHDYKPNTIYLHFFPRLESILLLDTSKDNYICTYDIPDEILNKHYGFATYWQNDPATNNPNTLEYAVPSLEIDYNYLIKVDKIIQTIYTKEELLKGECTEEIYPKSVHKTL